MAEFVCTLPWPWCSSVRQAYKILPVIAVNGVVIVVIYFSIVKKT